MAKSAHNGNPWVQQHVEGEMAFTGGEYTRSLARQIVEGEYDAGGGPVLCDPEQGGCGGQAFYKATVGVHVCPSCGELFHANGAVV